MPYVWLALAVVFLIVEAASVSVVSLWFAFGALAAMIAGFCGGEVWLQVVLFFAVSAVTLALLRPFVKRYLQPRQTKTNVDSLLGAEGLVTEDVDNLSGRGQIKIGGMYWTARSSSDVQIPQGTLIRIDRIEGVKAFVTPVTEENKIRR